MSLGTNHCVRHCRPDVTMLYHNDITIKTLRVSETLSNPLVTGGFTSPKNQLWGDFMFSLWLDNTLLNKQLNCLIFDMPYHSCHVTEMILQCTGSWSNTVCLWSSLKPTLDHFCVKAELIPREQSWEVIRMSCVQQQGPKSSHIYILCYF